MDALVKTAIESLVRKILPQLKEELSLVLKDSDQSPSTELMYLIEESRELLNLMSSWSQSQANSQKNAIAKPSNTALEIGDDEAMMMLAEMDEAPEASESVSEGEELSDTEANALLAEMEAPRKPDKKPSSISAPTPRVMGDDEASRLLAEMDEENSPPLAKENSTQSINDDEAARLLAEMDDNSPAPPPVQSKPASVQTAPKPEVASGDEHESDDLKEIAEWEPNDFQSDPSMLNDFIVNTDELMQILDDSILQLEQNPTAKPIIEEIFRAAHTLKGGSGMFGFKAIERVMHRMENLFDLIRKEKLLANSDTIDTVFAGLDMLRKLLQAVKDGKPCGVKTASVVRALSLAAQGKALAKTALGGASANSNQKSAPVEIAANNSAAKVHDEEEPKKDSGKNVKKTEQSTIRVDLERLDVLVNLIGELVIDRTRFASIEQDLRTNHPQLKLGSNFSESVQLFGRHMNEIQDIIMKVRMVPIGNAFNKFTRVVRDLSRSIDKKIELNISGESAELDKTLVEQIGDPLIHLIRNSCDHGIEMPDVRKAAGKNPIGKISLSAHQEGNQILIKIEDDGKGMDPQFIRRKAIEKGLISEELQLSDRDCLNLIFEAGFSTAEKVTNLSGRGVGMDVVKKQIMKLKGILEIDSAAGRGTTITIRLPLTLAIVQSLLVRARGETFAIPLNSVIESIRISPKDIQRIGDVEVYKLRETVLPLVHLEETMTLASKDGSISDLLKQKNALRKSRIKSDRYFVVVVGQPDRPTGVIVEQLLNQQEMVIKPMGPLMKNIPCVAGGAVLGHGEVVLVLDIPELEAASRGRHRVHAA
ncbi:MAG: chemotaxis protein CheA [Proteobacteria bacterium]|nr:chemotaxis protein CheA [Pseudomonadota bacterium]